MTEQTTKLSEIDRDMVVLSILTAKNIFAGKYDAESCIVSDRKYRYISLGMDPKLPELLKVHGSGYFQINPIKSRQYTMQTVCFLILRYMYQTTDNQPEPVTDTKAIEILSIFDPSNISEFISEIEKDLAIIYADDLPRLHNMEALKQKYS